MEPMHLYQKRSLVNLSKGYPRERDFLRERARRIQFVEGEAPTF